VTGPFAAVSWLSTELSSGQPVVDLDRASAALQHLATSDLIRTSSPEDRQLLPSATRAQAGIQDRVFPDARQ